MSDPADYRKRVGIFSFIGIFVLVLASLVFFFSKNVFFKKRKANAINNHTLLTKIIKFQRTVIIPRANGENYSHRRIKLYMFGIPMSPRFA